MNSAPHVNMYCSSAYLTLVQLQRGTSPGAAPQFVHACADVLFHSHLNVIVGASSGADLIYMSSWGSVRNRGDEAKRRGWGAVRKLGRMGWEGKGGGPLIWAQTPALSANPICVWDEGLKTYCRLQIMCLSHGNINRTKKRQNIKKAWYMWWNLHLHTFVLRIADTFEDA